MFRCRYRLSDKVVLGGTRGASAGDFDDANHGTTIEFNGRLPEIYEKVYDDTPGSEALNPRTDFNASYGLTTGATDTDSDGLADIAADGAATATITIQKKDKDGNDLTTGHSDAYFVEVNNGSVDAASGTLTDGTDSFVLQASSMKGAAARILVRNADGMLQGEITIKFR